MPLRPLYPSAERAGSGPAAPRAHPVAGRSRADAPLPPFSYAYQPIVDAADGRVVSYEALVRGPDGQPAASVLDRIPRGARVRFDRESRAVAIGLAARLELSCRLNLNMLPHGIAAGEDAVDDALRQAEAAGFAPERLVIEVTESDVIADKRGFAELAKRHKAEGVQLAIDDFGAGHSGLNLLVEFQPDQIKVDMALVRGIETDGPRQAVMRGVLLTCELLGIDVVAEGVETVDEYRWLRAQGVSLFQGYLFARPGFESLPPARLVGG